MTTQPSATKKPAPNRVPRGVAAPKARPAVDPYAAHHDLYQSDLKAVIVSRDWAGVESLFNEYGSFLTRHPDAAGEPARTPILAGPLPR